MEFCLSPDWSSRPFGECSELWRWVEEAGVSRGLDGSIVAAELEAVEPEGLLADQDMTAESRCGRIAGGLVGRAVDGVVKASKIVAVTSV